MIKMKLMISIIFLKICRNYNFCSIPVVSRLVTVERLVIREPKEGSRRRKVQSPDTTAADVFNTFFVVLFFSFSIR